MVTTARTVVAPSWVLAGVSWPLSVLTSQKVTQELITMMYRGMYTCGQRKVGQDLSFILASPSQKFKVQVQPQVKMGKSIFGLRAFTKIPNSEFTGSFLSIV